MVRWAPFLFLLKQVQLLFEYLKIMRIEKFESENLEPIGQGEENKVFVDPSNESHVIVERKDEAERDSFRQLRGRFYLTKIVHALMPNNIPDIYQTTETATGQQTIDRERVSHSEEQAELQTARKSGADEEAIADSMNAKMGKEMSDLTLKLSDIGLGFNIDENVGNYTQDESGNMYYLETFNPWQSDLSRPEGIEVLFNQETLKKAIDEISDPQTREQCLGYLKRLETLIEEEKTNNKAEVGVENGGPELSKLKAAFTLFELQHPLDELMAIKSADDADKSELRKSARAAVGLLLKELDALSRQRFLTPDQYRELDDRYRKISRAIGIINGASVDHTR
jgi:hypothetical protein